MTRKKWILLANANANDADQALRALAAGYAPPAVVVARDGAEVLNCLYRRNGFQTHHIGPPAIVLLELNLPKIDAWEVLRRVKGDDQLKMIPMVVLTCSRDAVDVARSYQLGANAYIVKPAHVRQLIAVLEEVRAFWIVINELPPEDSGKGNSATAQPASAASNLNRKSDAVLAGRRG